ncbi:MAG: ABC transporter permease [Salibacteraceae bacterium]
MALKSNIVSSSIYALLKLLGVAMVVFILFNLIPSDPAKLLAGKHSDEQQVQMIRNEIGLDRPLSARFINFLNEISFISFATSDDQLSAWKTIGVFNVGDDYLVFKYPYLGRSYAKKTAVGDLILGGLPETLSLVLAAIFLACLLGIPLGVFAAKNPDGKLDVFLRVSSAVGLAIPSFVAAIFIAWLFGYVLNNWIGLPISGTLFEYDVYAGKEMVQFKNLVLPAVALSIRPMSVTAQLMRNTMVEVLQKEYMRTAKAKGLPEITILFKHALVNAINPVMSAIGAWVAALMAASVFVEFIFGWKGLGSVLLTAIDYHDFPVIIGITLVVSSTFILTDWLISIISPNFDPGLARQ